MKIPTNPNTTTTQSLLAAAGSPCRRNLCACQSMSPIHDKLHSLSTQLLPLQDPHSGELLFSSSFF
jgi:hypothetical protein